MGRQPSDDSKDLQPDKHLLQRLAQLNRSFRLALAIDSGCTVLPLPSHHAGGPWQLIKSCISHLHRRHRSRLLDILDTYKEWAQVQRSKIAWVHKEDQDPCLLGDPSSHIQKILQLLNPPPSRDRHHSQLKKAQRVLLADSPRNMAESRAQQVSYPHFSQDHEVAIAQSKTSTSRSVDMQETTSGVDGVNPQSSRASSSARSAGKKRAVVDDAQSVRPYKNARKKLAFSHTNQTIDVRENPAAASFSRPDYITSFSTAATGSRYSSFNDTPATSFGVDAEINDATTKTANSGHLTEQNTVEAFSQASSGLQREMIQEEMRVMQMLAPPAPTNMLSSMQSTSTQASTPRLASIAASSRSLFTPSDGGVRHRINCSCGSEVDLFADGKSPFEVARCSPLDLPLHIAHEATRAAILAGESAEIVCSAIQTRATRGYKEAWAAIESACRSTAQRSSKLTWDTVESMPDSIILSGRMDLLKSPTRKLKMSFSLSPLKTQQKNSRLARKFGAHRIFTFTTSEIPVEHHEQFVRWLVCNEHDFLGRLWEVFFVKENKDKGTGPGRGNAYTIYAFATCGYGIAKQDELSRDGLLKWLLYTKKNAPEQSALKLFSRISLGLTDTQPGVEFETWQLVYTEDARSCCAGKRNLSDNRKRNRKSSGDGQSMERKERHKHNGTVMNDGAARISLAAASMITDQLGLDEVPSAFQGRIGGAKGVWITDYTGEELPSDHHPTAQKRDFWIEITESQLKFKVPTREKKRDKLHFTLDIHSWAHSLREHRLTGTIIPILEDRGVPTSVFLELLSDELRRQKDDTKLAMESGGPAFQKWIYDSQKLGAERASALEIKMAGGLPSSIAESMLLMSMAGFKPLEHHVLHSMTQKALEFHTQELLKKEAIDLPRSTYALMIPDPLGVLPAGQVHLSFSKPLRDPDDDTPVRKLKNKEVLVARFPAYLPSDIQKVTAVERPELAQYKDVIVFSSRTHPNVPGLAELLSGGDFDGDKALVCWEPKIVGPFRNSSLDNLVPADELAEELEIRKDKVPASDFTDSGDITGLVVHGFLHNMKRSMLGTCANWYMAYNYRERSVNKLPRIGQLLGLLVDAPKQGHSFGPEDWKALCQTLKVPINVPKPFYKDEGNYGENSRPTKHTLDQLHQQRRKDNYDLIQWFEDLAKDRKLQKYIRACGYPFKKVREEAMNLLSAWNLSLCDRPGNERGKKPVLCLCIEHLEKELKELRDWFERELNKIGNQERQGRSKSRDAQRHLERLQTNRLSVLIEARKKFERIKPSPEGAHVEPFKRFLESCSTPKSSTEWDLQNPSGPAISSEWTKFKASAFYELFYNTTLYNRLPWLIAGNELCQLQADVAGEVWFPVQLSALHASKPDGKVVKRRLESMLPPTIAEDEIPVGIPEEDGPFDDSMSYAGTMDVLLDD